MSFGKQLGIVDDEDEDEPEWDDVAIGEVKQIGAGNTFK